MNQNTFILLFYIIGTQTIFSQIINDGILQIKPATTVYFGEEYTNKTLGTHHNDGNLYLNSNFINNGSTSSISGTTFFKSGINDLLTISGATNQINFYNLEVDITGVTKKGVSVTNNFGLIVKNAVRLVSGDLRLIGEAQLVQTHTGINQNSSVSGQLLKDQQGCSSAFGYNYWSSPVNHTGAFSLMGNVFDGTDSSLNPFTPQPVSFNSGTPYNGLPSEVDGGGSVTTPLKINTRWLYKYLQGNNGEYAYWIKIDQNAALSPGTGFTMKGTNTLDTAQNYVFKGKPNDGEYLFPMVTGEFSLLGNPYPSSIDIHQFISDNSTVISSVLIWIDGGSPSHYLSEYLGGYAIQNLASSVLPSVASNLIAGVGNLTGIIPPTQYMAVGQGFLTEAIGDGNIIFNNSQRVFKTENMGDSNFYRTSNNATKNKSTNINSTIKIGYEDPEGFHRQLALAFLPGSPADLNFNQGYDALMTDPREDELFYIIENDLTKKYVIQGVGAYDELYTFPLSLTMTQFGTHTIMLDNVENFNDTVYIKDIVLNITHNLSESSFNPNLPPGEYHNRFQIVFQPATLSQDVLNKKEIAVYYNGDNTIIINNKNQLILKTVLISNILGQKIIQLNNSALRETEITIPFDYSKGLYLVKIETNQGNETFKILKY